MAHESIAKSRPFACEHIDIGRLHDLITVTPNRACCLIISEKEDHIRWLISNYNIASDQGHTEKNYPKQIHPYSLFKPAIKSIESRTRLLRRF
jgi:hypothetical protein